MVAFVLGTQAQDEPFRLENYNLGENNLAMDGYDPVAYFSEGRAIKGRNIFSYVHKGVLYYFASAPRRDQFASNPYRYEPEYGGWCAYQMGRNGEKVSINPKTFEIRDGRLYLFYNQFFVNTKTRWLKNRKELHSGADTHWQEWESGKRKEE